MTSWLKDICLIRNHLYNNSIFWKKYVEICKTNQKNRNIFQYAFFCLCFVLIQSVVSDSLQSHGQLHVRLPCPSLTISWSLLKLMSIQFTMPSNHFIPRHHLFLLPSTFSSIKIFSIQSAFCIRWPKFVLTVF